MGHFYRKDTLKAEEHKKRTEIDVEEMKYILGAVKTFRQDYPEGKDPTEKERKIISKLEHKLWILKIKGEKIE